MCFKRTFSLEWSVLICEESITGQYWSKGLEFSLKLITQLCVSKIIILNSIYCGIKSTSKTKSLFTSAIFIKRQVMSYKYEIMSTWKIITKKKIISDAPQEIWEGYLLVFARKFYHKAYLLPSTRPLVGIIIMNV